MKKMIRCMPETLPLLTEAQVANLKKTRYVLTVRSTSATFPS